MSLEWNNDRDWIFENKSLSGFAAPYIGNGTLGTRIGILNLGTDPKAPKWQGAANIPQRQEMYWGDPDWPLPTFSSFVYDSFQYALPTWNQLKLSIDGTEYTPHEGRHEFTHSLDLRIGESRLVDTWEYSPGKQALIESIMLIPRTHAHGSLWELKVKADNGSIKASFGLMADHLAADLPMRYSREGNMILGSGKTRMRGRNVGQGFSWKTDGQEMDFVIAAHSAQITVGKENGTLNITAFHSLHGGLEGDGCSEDVKRTLKDMEETWPKSLREQNSAIWKELWRNALLCDELDEEDQRLVLINQYYLLASLDTKAYPLGPLGISSNNWNGAQLWDADLWLGRALLPLWPQFARRIVSYRAGLIPKMREFAHSQKYDGAWFPWLHDEEGENRTPKEYLPEIHLNIWIPLAAWDVFQLTGDREVLSEQAWPLLKGAADFFASRCEKDSDGSWHLRGVVGPDEAVAERFRTTSNDNVLTNSGVRSLMKTAGEAAKLMEEPANPLWDPISRGLVILPPRKDNVIPEHADYVDQPIKQADTILAFHMDFLQMPEEVVRATVEFYRGRNGTGPLMTGQIESAIMIRLGDVQKGLQQLFTDYRRYVRGPFLVPFETPVNDTAVMLTGAGGLLQAMIYGLYGWRIGSRRKIPRIGDGW